MAENKKETVGVTPDPNEPVVVTRAEWEGLMGQIKNLTTGASTVRAKKVTSHTATLRFHEGKPVIWYGNVKEIKEKDTGKLVAWMDIELQGVKEKLRVEYLDFLNSPNSVRVLIKEQKLKEIRQSEGIITTVNPDQAKISSKTPWTPQEVEAEIVTRKYIATVEVIEGDHKGEVFILPNDCLNA